MMMNIRNGINFVKKQISMLDRSQLDTLHRYVLICEQKKGRVRRTRPPVPDH